MYHYQLTLNRDEKNLVGYQATRIEGVKTEEIPRALSWAMGRFADEFLNNFRNDRGCPSKLDIKVEFSD